MAEDEDEQDYENIELQEQDDDCDNIYANVETKTRPTAPTAQDNDSQKTQQSGIRGNRQVLVGVGLLCAVLALISIGAPLYLNQSNLVEREQLLARINNLTVERDQLQIGFDRLKTSHNNLTAQNNQLQTSFEQLKTCFDQLKTSHNNLNEERDDRKMLFCESPGWQKLDRGCYYVSTGQKNWEESRLWCRERLSDLIVINSKEEQDFVASFNKRVWLGLTDRVREGSFQWVDGAPLTTPTYWLPRHPYNASSEDDCVEFYDGSQPAIPQSGWNDLVCSANLWWICERVLC